MPTLAPQIWGAIFKYLFSKTTFQVNNFCIFLSVNILINDILLFEFFF